MGQEKAFHEMLGREMMAAPVPGVVISARLGGSRGVNLHEEGSDWDLHGVYAAPTEELLGLGHVRESVVRNSRPALPDVHFHELGHFCRLLAKGSPQCLEALWAERAAFVTPLEGLAAAWGTLRQERHRFLSGAAVRKYLGHALGLLREVQEAAPGDRLAGKRCCQMVRLLQDAGHIVGGGGPLAWREGPESRDALLAFRRGERPPSEAVALAGTLVSAIDARKPWPLPEEPDHEWLDAWLVGTRLLLLGMAGSATGHRLLSRGLAAQGGRP